MGEILVDCNKIIKEGHIAEAASETEFIVPNEGGSRSAMEVHSVNSQLESSVEPVKEQLEIPEVRERDPTVEIKPQIIPAIVEESSAQIEEDKPVPEALKVRQLLSSSSYLLIVTQLKDDTSVFKAAHVEPLDTTLVQEEPVVVESEPDALLVDTSIPVVPTAAIAVAAQAPEVQEDATVIPEAESDLPKHEIQTEGSSSIEEGDVVHDSSSFVDTEVQPEAQEQEEVLPSTVTKFFDERNIY